MKKSVISILALLLMVSCQINELAPEYVHADEDLYASIESVDATKTVMDENNNILWSEEDQLVAFMKTTLGVKYQIKEQFVGTSTGGFSKINEPGNDDDLEAGQELDHNVVLYPHSYDVWCMKNDKNTPTQSYKLNVILPETQTYEENSFGIGAFPMIAVATDNKLTFRNICGGLKLQFKGVDKIKSIKLEGLGGEKISGKSTVVGYVDGSVPVITMANNDKSYTHVTLDCGEGVQLSETTPTTFIIAVPPVEFASGMKITVTDTDGLSKTLTNSSANTIKRSCLTRFPVITYKQEGVFELPEGTLTSHEIPAEGGTVEIPLTTNQEYEVVIPEDAQEWISVVETKALRNETVALSIAENNTTAERSAEVIIATPEGAALQAITVLQKGIEINPNRTIFYKSTDGKIITARGTDPFGANLISNTYENGQGMMIFDADVKKIGEEAFRMCTTLKEIILPSSTKSIEYEAFVYCSNLECAITIPESVTTIEERAFMGCNKVSAYYGKFASSDNRALVNNGTMIAFAPYGLTEYTTPSEVTALGNWLLYQCNELKSLTISDNITKIGEYAVYYCVNIESLTIGNNVNYIGKEAFWRAYALDHIIVPAKVTHVGMNAFDTNYLKSITFLSTTPPTFESYANIFGYYKPLIYVPYASYTQYYNAISSSFQTHIIGGSSSTNTQYAQNEIKYNSNTTVKVYDTAFKTNSPVFNSASGGKGTIRFSSDLTTIERFAFDGNKSLAAMSFPEGVTTLESYVFDDCNNLTSVTLPASITQIGRTIIDNTFRNFRSLYCKASIPPVVDTSLFEDDDISGIKIYVPYESLTQYKSADIWKNYADIIVGYNF